MAIREYLLQNKSKYPDKNTLIQKTVETLKCSRDAALRTYNKIDLPTPSIGLTEKDIRARHDMMYKIREGAKTLQKGVYLTDQQMREHCQVPPNVWRGYSENQEFEVFKLKLGKVLYWGIPAGVEKLRRDLCVS